MWKIRAFPSELKRILLSPDIVKVGVGVISDILQVWDDLRTEMINLVDAGMMAKLLLAEKYPTAGYCNLSLKISVADILGYNLRKNNMLLALLAEKSSTKSVDIPSAWYTLNTRYGEPTRIRRSAL
ncbi:hypothetical protein DFH06DRAFT_1472731 [Mycena polygramma]|nr:hypothetical protein DFH06DRAFT_1472731 [Mycena polygramma]